MTDQTGSATSSETARPGVLLERGRQAYAEAVRGGEGSSTLETARSYLRQAFDGYTSAGDASGAAEAANDLGVLGIVERRYGDAEQWLRAAQQQFASLQDYGGEAQTLGNLGRLYQARGDLTAAAAHLQQAVDRFHLVGDNARRSSTFRLLSIVRLRQFRPLHAVQAYQAALACHPEQTLFRRLLQRFLALPVRVMMRQMQTPGL